ncbi:uncharacterized protein LOC144450794 [Glandiceps talaboti]
MMTNIFQWFAQYCIVVCVVQLSLTVAQQQDEDTRTDVSKPCGNGIPGIPGIPGTAGVQGAVGSKGDSGSPGLDGTPGEKGDTGELGSRGQPGLKGKTGKPGPKGAKGEIGQKGMDGVEGQNGTKGDTGIKGNKGSMGGQGIQGPKGGKGEVGQKGIDGLKGSMGGQGIQGPKGDRGLIGQSGRNGLKGQKGLAGQMGIKGVQGSMGGQGIQGPKGHKGEVGQVQQQPRVAFSVAKTTSMGPVSSSTVIVYDKVYSNDGNGYSTSTGKFTCPVSGMYYFMISALRHNSNHLYVCLIKNTTRLPCIFVHNSGGRSHGAASNSVIIDIDHGDEIWVRLVSGTAVYSDSNEYTTFTGYLLYSITQ